MTDLTSPLGAQLDALESQLASLAHAVAAGDVQALGALAPQLQQWTVALAQTWQQCRAAGDLEPAQVRRTQALAQGVQQVRTQLIRRMGIVEQALHLVLPATQEPTYAAGAAPAGVYGGAYRGSGRLPVLSA